MMFAKLRKKMSEEQNKLVYFLCRVPLTSAKLKRHSAQGNHQNDRRRQGEYAADRRVDDEGRNSGYVRSARSNSFSVNPFHLQEE